MKKYALVAAPLLRGMGVTGEWVRLIDSYRIKKGAALKIAKSIFCEGHTKDGQQVKIGKIELVSFISEKRYLHCLEHEMFVHFQTPIGLRN